MRKGGKRYGRKNEKKNRKRNEGICNESGEEK